MSELSKLVRHWAACAALTSEQRSCLSVEQLNWIADELESRTLTVKLPASLMPAQHNSGELFMSPDDVEQGGYLNRDDVVRVLRTAGIKLQIEGE